MLTKEEKLLIEEAKEEYTNKMRLLMLNYKDKKTKEEYMEYTAKSKEYMEDLVACLTENIDDKDSKSIEIFYEVYKTLVSIKKMEMK